MSTVTVMFGEAPMPGHKLVTLPNSARRGAGINRVLQPFIGGSE